MAQTIATDPKEDFQKKIAEYINTKRYVDEPDLLPWYKKDVQEIKPRTRELLETYSKILPTEVESHVKKVVSPPIYEGVRTSVSPTSAFSASEEIDTITLKSSSSPNTHTARLGLQNLPIPMSRKLGLPKPQRRRRVRLLRSHLARQGRRTLPRYRMLHGPRHARTCGCWCTISKHIRL